MLKYSNSHNTATFSVVSSLAEVLAQLLSIQGHVSVVSYHIIHFESDYTIPYNNDSNSTVF